MRKFSKKLAFVLAAAMVFTAFAPAASAKAADDMVINKKSQILYVTDGTRINDDKNVPDDGKTVKGNVAEYDFWVKNKPTNYGKLYKFDWKSSKPTVATVDQKGLTKAVSIGTATITCTITDKATGKEVAAPTVKVEVKKNATSVKITNAPASDAVYGVGDTVDLNRTMIDNNGKKGGRGKYVTDYTKWVAVAPNGDSSLDKNIGVTIDQSNGKYTFTEAAADGKYEFYCYTYQSSKYPKATATSEKITVTFQKTKTFSIDQTTSRDVKLYFSTAVSSLKTADVKVYNVRFDGYPIPVKVQSVKLAEDGLSADVKFFYALDDNIPYKFTVPGFEDNAKVLHNGVPADMVLVAVNGNNPYDVKADGVLTTGVATRLVCVFYDINQVEVGRTFTDKDVALSVTKLAANGDYIYTPSSNTLKFNKAGVPATIKAAYRGRIENGKRVGQFEREFSFYALDAQDVSIVGVADYTVNGQFGAQAQRSFEYAKNITKTLGIKLALNGGTGATNAVPNTSGMPLNSVGYDKCWLSFTALDPEVCVINSSGVLTAHQAGLADFYVNLKVGNADPYPIDVITIEVKEASYLMDFNTLAQTVTVGTVDGFNTESVTFEASSQYGAYGALDAAKVTINCLTDGFGDAADILNAVTKSVVASRNVANSAIQINVDGLALRDEAFTKAAPTTVNTIDNLDNGQIFALDFEIKYDNAFVMNLVVYVQEPDTSVDNNVVIVDNSTNGYIDATRVKVANNPGAAAEKNVTFKAYQMNNGIKVAEIQFVDEASATAGDYFFKVLRNYEELDASVASKLTNVMGTVVPAAVIGASLPLSTTKDLDGRANTVGGINAKVVSYENLGEGFYQFIIFKLDASGNSEWVTEQGVAVGVSDYDSYYEAGDQNYNHVEFNATELAASYSQTIEAKILNCFNINGWDNTSTKDQNGVLKANDVYVDYTPVSTSKYVYVKEITYFEQVGTESATPVYVPYVVYLDRALDLFQ